MKDKTTAKVSVFEAGVLQAVKIICMMALVDVLIIFFVQGIVRDQVVVVVVIVVIIIIVLL